MNLEDQLRSALRRENPPAGFAGRTVARAQSTAPKRLMWATGIAAMLAIGFVAQFEYRQMQAERAGREAVIALRIASEKLNLTRDKLLKLTEN